MRRKYIINVTKLMCFEQTLTPTSLSLHAQQRLQSSVKITLGEITARFFELKSLNSFSPPPLRPGMSNNGCSPLSEQPFAYETDIFFFCRIVMDPQYSLDVNINNAIVYPGVE